MEARSGDMSVGWSALLGVLLSGAQSFTISHPDEVQTHGHNKIKNVSCPNKVKQNFLTVKARLHLKHWLQVTANGCEPVMRGIFLKALRVCDVKAIAVSHPIAQVAQEFQFRRSIKVAMLCQDIAQAQQRAG
jgi:hypothetical protein